MRTSYFIEPFVDTGLGNSAYLIGSDDTKQGILIDPLRDVDRYLQAASERGIQVTAQRLAVLRAVAGQPHITADAVAEAVRMEIGAISLQSVYDALGLLVSQGLIRRIQPSGSPARFEDRVGDNHHHLICRVCGRVVDVDCAVGAAPCLTPADDRGYEIDEAEVAYWGRCPDCVEHAPAAPADTPAAPND